MKRFLVISYLIPLAAVPGLALAADVIPAKSSPQSDVGEAKPDWTIDLGGGGGIAPKFAGGKGSKFVALPYFAIDYKDIAFASTRGGIGANILNSSGFQAGPLLTIAGGRKEKDDRRYLTGLGEVATTIEGGAFLKYAFDPYFETKIEVRKGIGDIGAGRDKILAAQGIKRNFKGHQGIVAEWSADVNAPPLFNERLFLSAGPRVSYFDKDYAKAYYGVSALQSQRSGYAPFAPKGGIGEIGLGAKAIFRVTPQISVATFADYARLVGDVSKSPIVRGKGGSRDQFTAGTAIAYRFSL